MIKQTAEKTLFFPVVRLKLISKSAADHF